MKEISEKTFELNITNELLNISKSFIWYMIDSPINRFMSENDWFDFLKDKTFFAEGLTQKQEANTETGGYDVSISYLGNNELPKRLMFLQYKSGVKSNFCKNSASQFHRSCKKKRPSSCF